MFKIGVPELGIVSRKFDELESTITQIFIYPFKISIEKLNEERICQIRIILLDKYEIGVFVQY
jgi:hypothetical protein|tara:strand:- start:4098 stop:4286 length:189 start_codon:yes stop_codon:yes gene_type:complete